MTFRHHKNKPPFWFSSLLFVITSGFASNVQALTYTTIQDGVWQDATTWLGGNIPPASLDGHIVNIDHIVKYDLISDLYLKTGTINVAGTLSIQNHSAILDDPAGSININSGVLVFDHMDLTNQAGSINLSAGAIELCNGSFSNNSASGVLGNGTVQTFDKDITNSSPGSVSSLINWCSAGVGTGLPIAENCGLVPSSGQCQSSAAQACAATAKNITFAGFDKNLVYSATGQDFPSHFNYAGANGNNIWNINIKGSSAASSTAFDPKTRDTRNTNGSGVPWENPEWPNANGLWFQGIYPNELIDYQFSFTRVSGTDPLGLYMHTGESLDDERDTLTTTGSDWLLGRFGKMTEAPNVLSKTAIFEDNGMAKGIDTGVGYWELSTSFAGNSGAINWNYDYLDADMSFMGTNMVSFEVAENCLVAPIPPPTNQCFAMADNAAELYSFDLDISTAPTMVPTGMILNGEGATYRATDNAIYTFHQPAGEVIDNPSDLYKVELDGTTTLIKANFMTEQGVGAEFVNYADGSERLIVLLREWDSRIQIYDATDLTNTTPLSTIPLFFPDGSNAYVDSLAINPATGEVLVVDDTDDNSDLAEIYSVDMSTGKLTLKVIVNVPGIDAESLAFAEDGNVYMEQEDYGLSAAYINRIFRVDLSTGGITPVEENIDSVVSGDIEGMSCTGSKIVTPTGAPSISGAVFKDANKNDVFEASEAGIGNISVWLQRVNADGTIDPVKVPANTNALGKYLINGLADGNYQVHVDITDTDIPAGHLIGGLNPLVVTIAGVAVTDVDFPFDEAVCTAFNDEVTEVNLPITSQLKTGDKLFVPSKSASSPVGHLRAFSVDVNGVPATTADWDAADPAKMTDRANKLFSNDTSGNFVLFNTLAAPSTTIKNYTIAAVLGGISRGNSVNLLNNSMDTSLYLYDTHYRDYYKNTVSTRTKQVLMSSDDGFLYAVNYDTGILKWAWMPRSLITELKGTNSYQSKHLMAGTVEILDLKDSANNYATYVIGSYKHGLGHFILKLTADGSLGSVIWDEDQSSAFVKSPNNGEMEFFKDGNGVVHAAYTLTNSVNTSRLTIKTLTDTTTDLRIDLNYQATSSPFVMQDYGRSNAPAKKTLYVGTSTGKIHSAALLTTGNVLETAANIKTDLESTEVAAMDINPTDAVIYINSSISAKDNQYYLSAQTATRLTIQQYDSSSSSWKKKWTSYVSGAGSWNTSGTYTADTSATVIQSLPADSTVTDKAVIVADTVVLPISVLDSASTACYGKAYYYLYSLTDGSFPKNSFFKTDNTAITTNIDLGYGEARQLMISDLLGKDQLLGFGLSDQNKANTIELGSPFVIKDPVATGIRGWKELGR